MRIKNFAHSVLCMFRLIVEAFALNFIFKGRGFFAA